MSLTSPAVPAVSSPAVKGIHQQAAKVLVEDVPQCKLEALTQRCADGPATQRAAQRAAHAVAAGLVCADLAHSVRPVWREVQTSGLHKRYIYCSDQADILAKLAKIYDWFEPRKPPVVAEKLGKKTAQKNWENRTS